VELVLHTLRRSEGPALLVLHGLGERTEPTLAAPLDRWPGSVHGLDFTGHGDSTTPRGGGYTPEWLAADADIALAAVGPCALWGRGLGAYVALLLAGARPDQVRGAVLADGPGIAGADDGFVLTLVEDPVAATGAFEPRTDRSPSGSAHAVADPRALAELSADRRTAAYALAQHEAIASVGDLPLMVSATERPSWLAALVARPGVQLCSPPEALDRLAAC
jgi:pimeloyl-ACP methyl ester carboxylesterase